MYNLFNHPLHSLTGRLKTLNRTPKVGHPPNSQGAVFYDQMRPLQNSPKSPKFPSRHLGDFP
ncbi:hypothetical protein NM96_06685 [Neisseria mucosa]|nr:hypothetical protein NM96_06685 [Neisseria mucosa]